MPYLTTRQSEAQLHVAHTEKFAEDVGCIVRTMALWRSRTSVTVAHDHDTERTGHGAEDLWRDTRSLSKASAHAAGVVRVEAEHF